MHSRHDYCESHHACTSTLPRGNTSESRVVKYYDYAVPNALYSARTTFTHYTRAGLYKVTAITGTQSKLLS